MTPRRRLAASVTALAVWAAPVAVVPAAITMGASSASAASASTFSLLRAGTESGNNINAIDPAQFQATLDRGIPAEFSVLIGGIERTTGISVMQQGSDRVWWNFQPRPEDAGKSYSVTVRATDPVTQIVHSKRLSGTVQAKSFIPSDFTIRENGIVPGASASVSVGTTPPVGVAVEYEWNSIPATVSRTGETVEVPEEWAGLNLSVRAQVTTPGWGGGFTQQSRHAVGLLAVSGTSQIVGSGRVGQPLSASHDYDIQDATYRYEWSRSASPTATPQTVGTGATYTPRAADAGQFVSLLVTVSSPRHREESFWAQNTVKVGAAPSKALVFSAPKRVKTGKKITVTVRNVAKGAKVVARGGHSAKKVTVRAKKAGTVKVAVPALKLKRGQRSAKAKVTVTVGKTKRVLRVTVVR